MECHTAAGRHTKYIGLPAEYLPGRALVIRYLSSFQYRRNIIRHPGIQRVIRPMICDFYQEFHLFPCNSRRRDCFLSDRQISRTVNRSYHCGRVVIWIVILGACCDAGRVLHLSGCAAAEDAANKNHPLLAGLHLPNLQASRPRIPCSSVVCAVFRIKNLFRDIIRQTHCKSRMRPLVSDHNAVDDPFPLIEEIRFSRFLHR